MVHTSGLAFDRVAWGIAALTKIAALDSGEQKLFQQVVRKQQEFDRQASGGKMTAAQQEAHRANTERLQHFLSKKKDSAKKIPDWAKDPMGAKPGGTGRRARGGGPPPPGQSYRYTHGPERGPFMKFVANHPYATSAGLGALYGGVIGTAAGALRPEAVKQQELKKAKKDDPAPGA